MSSLFDSDEIYYRNFSEIIEMPPLWNTRKSLGDFYMLHAPPSNFALGTELRNKYNETKNEDMYIAMSDLNFQTEIAFPQRKSDFVLDKMSLLSYLNILKVSKSFINKFNSIEFLSYDDTFIRTRSPELSSCLGDFLKKVATGKIISSVGLPEMACSLYSYYADSLARFMLAGALYPDSKAAKFAITVENILLNQFKRWVPNNVSADYCGRMPPEINIGLFSQGLDYIIDNNLQEYTHEVREPCFRYGFELYLLDMMFNTNLTQSLTIETAVGMLSCAKRVVSLVTKERCIESALAPVDRLRGAIIEEDRATVAANLGILLKHRVISADEYTSLKEKYGTWGGGDKFYE